ncbi:transposable element Tcb2 transposase [Trichonephila clavipes]|nr:transposable element Tcb2 transposase [Trichonephila clavipes]
MEAGWSARRVARQLGRSDCVEWCHARGNWTAAEGNQVVISDESRFNLSSDDNRVREWRPRRERLNPTFALQRHTSPTAGGMVWSAFAYNTRSPLVLIRGPMTAQWYVHDILQPPHMSPLMQRLPGAIFQQDNALSHTARVSQGCLHTVTTFALTVRSPYLSSIEHIWDHLGRRVGYPTSLNELKARGVLFDIASCLQRNQEFEAANSMQCVQETFMVNKPIDWINSLVVVEKPNGKLRICLDIRNLNKAIRRAKHIFPTSEELISRLEVPLRHGGTLNSRQATSLLMLLGEVEERREAPGHRQGFLPLNWGGTEPNRIVTCMVLKAKANDRRKNCSS